VSDDDFDVFEDASPVTSEDEDTVDTEFEDLEAAAERRRRRTHGAEAERGEASPSRNGEADHVRYAAACRWCGSMFATAGIADAHECREEPVSSCRFCREVHTSGDDIDEHLYTCERFRRHNERQVIEGGDGASDSFSDRRFIDPWYHEFQAYVKYDVGLRSYFGLN